MSDPDLYQQIIDIIRRVLRIEEVDPMADIFDLGATSVALLCRSSS